MNNKRTWIEKLSDFISGKGFYLVVLICVAAIALSGYYLVQGLGGEDDPGQPVAGSASIADGPSPVLTRPRPARRSPLSSPPPPPPPLPPPSRPPGS